MFKDDLTTILNHKYAQKLVGRYVKGCDDIIGEISTVDLKYNSCEVCINFTDGVRMLETRFTIDYWLENSFTRDQLIKQFKKHTIINNKK